MAFVKLDCGILDSTLWVDREARELFITALLMAEPREYPNSPQQIHVSSLEFTGWSAPPGWYGFVAAAGIGIIRRSGVDPEVGMLALARLGSPENESRNPQHEGRRLIRVDGGYLVLNFMSYREKDNTAAVRSRRYRQRQKELSLRRDGHSVTRDSSCGVTNAEAEAEAEAEEELEKDTKNPPTPQVGVVAGLDASSWDRWIDYRKQIRKPLKPVSIPAAQRELAAYGSDQASVVEQSIAKGWTGLFELKYSAARAPPLARKTADEAEEEARARGEDPWALRA